MRAKLYLNPLYKNLDTHPPPLTSCIS